MLVKNTPINAGVTETATATDKVAATVTTPPGAVKVSLNLPAQVVETLRQLAAQEGRTMTEIIRRGIEMEGFLADLRAKNSKVLVKGADGEVAEVVFK